MLLTGSCSVRQARGDKSVRISRYPVAPNLRVSCVPSPEPTRAEVFACAHPSDAAPSQVCVALPCLAGRSPQPLRIPGTRKFWFPCRLLAIVEESIHRNFQRPRILLKRFDGGDGVTVFDTGRIAAQQAGAVFDIALAEFLRFAEFPESLTYHHAVRLQPIDRLPQGHVASGRRKGAIESPNHACESVANIRLPGPQRRFRRTAILSPAEKLLASAAVLPLYGSSGEAIGVGGGLARLFGSCPPSLQTILDALGMEGRSRVECLCAVRAACAPYGGARSAHGQNEVCAVDGQRFPTSAALG